jgi:phosphorylcholine metabolism protein LicD
MNLHKIEVTDETDLSPVLLPEEYLSKMNLMLKKILQFFKDNELEYWIDGGTLLGAVRDKGQIPYDDDMDFGMEYKSFFKLRRLIPELEKMGYRLFDQLDDVIKISDCDNMYSRIYGTENEQPIEIARACCIDIFLYANKKDEYMLSDKKNRETYKNCIYKKKDLFPLVEYDYDDVKLTGANNPYPYLESYYGDWKKKVVYVYL